MMSICRKHVWTLSLFNRSQTYDDTLKNKHFTSRVCVRVTATGILYNIILQVPLFIYFYNININPLTFFNLISLTVIYFRLPKAHYISKEAGEEDELGCHGDDPCRHRLCHQCH